MVRDMAHAGVVAFITPEPVAPEVVSEADDSNVPIFKVGSDNALAEIEKSLVDVLVDPDRAIRQRVQEVYERLLAPLVEDRGLELISAIVADVTDRKSVV